VSLTTPTDALYAFSSFLTLWKISTQILKKKKKKVVQRKVSLQRLLDLKLLTCSFKKSELSILKITLKLRWKTRSLEVSTVSY